MPKVIYTLVDNDSERGITMFDDGTLVFFISGVRYNIAYNMSKDEDDKHPPYVIYDGEKHTYDITTYNDLGEVVEFTDTDRALHVLAFDTWKPSRINQLWHWIKSLIR